MIKRIFATIKSHNLYSQATILFIATSFGNMFSLLYHVFMVRNLTPEEFGILNVLFACIIFFAMPTGNLQIAITRFVARYHGLESKAAMYKLLKGMVLRILVVAGGVSLLIILLSKPLAVYFKITNLTPIYSMAGVVIVSLLMPLPLAGLQGLQKFLSLGIVMILMNMSKFFLGVLLVKFGFGVSGALNALTFATLLCVLVALPILRKGLRKLSFDEEKEVYVNFKEVYKYLFPVALATLSFVLLTNLDIILVKHYFTPLEAGYYSIAQMIGKMVLFLPLAICMVMFPKVANSHVKEEETISHLKHASVYIISLVVVASLTIFMMPGAIIKLFTGQAYVQCYGLVRRFAISMGLFVVCFNFLLYYLSLNRIKYMSSFLILLVCEGIAIYFWHNSLIQVLNIVIATASLLFLINLFVIKKNFI